MLSHELITAERVDEGMPRFAFGDRIVIVNICDTFAEFCECLSLVHALAHLAGVLADLTP